MTETELQKLLEELLLEGENEFTEFKQSFYDFDELGKYFSALANGACLRNKDFGFLVFGIEDLSHNIKGAKLTFEENKKPLELHFRTHISPKTKFEIHRFSYKEAPIVLFKFTAAKGEPVLYNKTSWGRINSHIVDLRNEKYSDLLQKIYNSDTDWSAQIIKEASFEDLSPEAVNKACDKIREKRRNLTHLTNQQLLLDKARITIDGKITRTSLILLGKPESANFLIPSQAEIIHRLVGWNLAPNEITSKTFHPPFFLTLNDTWNDIRNNKVKVFTNNSLYPDSVDKYDSEAVLEALNNCIAHQDYTENNRIVLNEKPDRLIFENAGDFFEGKVEDYIEGTKTPKKYRNKFLADAMRELGIVDTEGSGINKIYLAQIRKFFPAPDYRTDNREVSVTIYGKIIDERFSQILMEKDLDFPTTLLLDRIQKNLPVGNEDVKILKKQNLIEGRKPRYFIAAEIASATNQKEKYIKNRAFSKQQYKAWVLEYLDKFKEMSRKDIDEILMGYLSDILSIEAKKKKIDNLLQEMSKKDKAIKNCGTFRSPKWRRLGED